MTRTVCSSAALLAVAACVNPPSSARVRADDGGPPSTPDAEPAPLVVDAAAAADPDAGPDAAPTPDLTVNPRRAVADLALEHQSFGADACELKPEEDCVGAPGDRRLLRFAVETPNLGRADLYLGVPDPANPNFVWSPCHEHWHFVGYAEYRLVDGSGVEVAEGRKQAFCLLDSEPYAADAPALGLGQRYSCSNQGIHAGWSDVYHTRLPCQFIDVTGVPDGDYTLVVALNTARKLVEGSYDNNRVEIPVQLGDDALFGPTEPCPDTVDERSAKGTHRECGWQLVDTIECEPGARFTIGCHPGCFGGPLGGCTGDPMLRLCDTDHPSGNCTDFSKIGASDDACGSVCPRLDAQLCPASGRVAVYAAASRLGGSYSCELAVEQP
jgi:hypothetical protein